MTQTSETDAELLRDVLEVVRDLDDSYSARYGQVEARPAADIVKELCGIVRAAPAHLLLPRLARKWRLTNEGLVCVSVMLLRCCGIAVDTSLNHVVLLSCGLSPLESIRFRRALLGGTGHGHLVRVNQAGMLYPAPELVLEVLPEAPSLDWARMRDEVGRMPTAKEL